MKMLAKVQEEAEVPTVQSMVPPLLPGLCSLQGALTFFFTSLQGNDLSYYGLLLKLDLRIRLSNLKAYEISGENCN